MLVSTSRCPGQRLAAWREPPAPRACAGSELEFSALAPGRLWWPCKHSRVYHLSRFHGPETLCQGVSAGWRGTQGRGGAIETIHTAAGRPGRARQCPALRPFRPGSPPSDAQRCPATACLLRWLRSRRCVGSSVRVRRCPALPGSARRWPCPAPARLPALPGGSRRCPAVPVPVPGCPPGVARRRPAVPGAARRRSRRRPAPPVLQVRRDLAVVRGLRSELHIKSHVCLFRTTLGEVLSSAWRLKSPKCHYSVPPAQAGTVKRVTPSTPLKRLPLQRYSAAPLPAVRGTAETHLRAFERATFQFGRVPLGVR